MEEQPVRLGKQRLKGKFFLSEHGEDKDHGLFPQSEPSEKNLERIHVASVKQV